MRYMNQILNHPASTSPSTLNSEPSALFPSSSLYPTSLIRRKSNLAWQRTSWQQISLTSLHLGFEVKVNSYPIKFCREAKINSGFRPDHNRQTSHENKLVPKKAKSTRMHSSESSMRALCQMAESAIARIEVLEKFDEEHVLAERPQTSGSDDTLRASDGDINRRLTKMLETALARISVLEQRRDICYTNAFKTTNAEGCLIRGCDAKPSQKNFIRHVKTTSTPEHEVAAAILKQTDCLQCGLHWQTPSGLAYHEALIHDENHPSRMDAFKPFLQQSLGKCLTVMTCSVWPTGRRLYNRKPNKTIIAVGIELSTTWDIRPDRTNRATFQRSPALGRQDAYKCFRTAMAAWTRQPTARHSESDAIRLAQLQRSAAIDRSDISIPFDATTTVWTHRSFTRSPCFNAAGLV